MAAWFWDRGSSMTVRGLDRRALEKLAGPGNTYGLDNEFFNYFDTGA
jgi:hypothetical protein